METNDLTLQVKLKTPEYKLGQKESKQHESAQSILLCSQKIFLIYKFK